MTLAEQVSKTEPKSGTTSSYHSFWWGLGLLPFVTPICEVWKNQALARSPCAATRTSRAFPGKDAWAWIRFLERRTAVGVSTSLQSELHLYTAMLQDSQTIQPEEVEQARIPRHANSSSSGFFSEKHPANLQPEECLYVQCRYHSM